MHVPDGHDDRATALPDLGYLLLTSFGRHVLIPNGDHSDTEHALERSPDKRHARDSTPGSSGSSIPTPLFIT